MCVLVDLIAHFLENVYIISLGKITRATLSSEKFYKDVRVISLSCQMTSGKVNIQHGLHELSFLEIKI